MRSTFTDVLNLNASNRHTQPLFSWLADKSRLVMAQHLLLRTLASWCAVSLGRSRHEPDARLSEFRVLLPGPSASVLNASQSALIPEY